MAHGLPDYYRGVDIAYQALAQLITRPMYGGAQRVAGNTVVTASAETILASVSGKGMIYDGIWRLDHTSTQNLSIPRLYVDGSLIGNLMFFHLNKYAIWYEGDYSIHTLMYDNTNFIYSASISHGITFETSFKIAYLEEHGSTPTVWHDVTYALV